MSIQEYDNQEHLAQLEFDRLTDANGVDELSTAQSEVIGLINTAMTTAKAGILPLPRFEEDTFVSTRDIKDLASRISMNTKVLLSECEAIMATAQVVGSLLSGIESSVQESCSGASEAVRTLLAYHQAMSNSGRSVSVIPSHLTGTFTLIGNRITSGLSGGRDASARVTTIETNGDIGNFIELRSGTPSGRNLSVDEIAFVDSNDARNDPSLMTDSDDHSLMEIESYVVEDRYVAAVVDENVMPNSLTKVQKAVRSNGQPVTMVPVDWSSGPEAGSLYADITLENESGVLSGLAIKTADRTDSQGLAIPYPTIERVDVSLDNKSWSQVDCRSDAIASAAGGEIIVHVNSNACRYVRVRLRQTVSYSTVVANACHWVEPADGSAGKWMTGSDEPVYKIGLHQKRSWFIPTLSMDVTGNKVRRKIFGLSSRRYALAIKEIRGEVYSYLPDTIITSKTYTFDKQLDRVMIHTEETVPDGTSIVYEISPDRGGSWIPIIPIERSGSGAEVIVFSQGGGVDPNLASATYVQVKERPTSLMVRIKLSATDTISPSVDHLSIEPIFFEE